MEYKLDVDARIGRGGCGHPVDVLIPETVTGKGNETAVIGLN